MAMLFLLLLYSTADWIRTALANKRLGVWFRILQMFFFGYFLFIYTTEYI